MNDESTAIAIGLTIPCASTSTTGAPASASTSGCGSRASGVEVSTP
jgi:hypothetical protein